MTMEKAGSEQAAVRGSRMPADERNLIDYLRVVLKYRWIICLVCIIAVLAAGLTSYFSTPKYVATASVVPPMDSLRRDSGLAAGLLGGGASLLRQVMDVSSVVDMYVGILQSRAATDAIIDRFDLMHVYDVDSSRHRARAMLQRGTSLKVSDDGILYITVEDTDRNRVAAIANAYVEELDRLNKKLSAGQTTSKRIFLETRLQDMRTSLSQQDIPRQEEEVQEMLYQLLMREFEIAKIEEAKSMPTIQVLDEAVPPEQRKARGTVRKAALAGIVAFVVMTFFVFAREYWIACAQSSPPAPGRSPARRDLGWERRPETALDKVRLPSMVEPRSRCDEPISESIEMS
jgi:uncharacterized protein involved in exopolysaccharide biosynthesis